MLFDFDEYIKVSTHRQYWLILIYFLQSILIILPVIVYAKLIKKLNFESFGLRKIKVWNNFKTAIWGYLTFLMVNFVFMMIILYVNVKIPGYQLQDPILPFFGNGIESLILAGILIIGVAPFIEEFFFRGFILPTMVNKWGTTLGSILTAAIFATLHLQFNSIIPIFILGLIINAMVIKTKSIWPAITFHIINNSIAFTLEVLLITEVLKPENII